VIEFLSSKRDEAIAKALEFAKQDGGTVAIHSEGCAQRGDDDRDCNCTPLVLKPGAEA
jgi:hypothetical protein